MTMTELGKLAPAQALASAGACLRSKRARSRELADRLDENFVRAVEIVLGCNGRVVVSGIGKSGHIARKIASTLASTGTPAFFVHPAEASHGDLGMVTRDDVMIALSNSGESAELLVIVPLIKRQGAQTDRHHRQSGFDARARSRRPSLRQRGEGSLLRSASRPPPARRQRSRWATRWPLR